MNTAFEEMGVVTRWATSFTIGLALFVTGSGAVAGEKEAPYWKAAPFDVLRNGKYIGKVETVYVANAAPTVLIVCYAEAYRAFISKEPIDWRAAVLDNENNSWRDAYVDITIADKVETDSKWLYLKKFQVLGTPSSRWAVRIFNAAAQGNPIEIDFSRWGVTRIDLPPVDSGFRWFDDRCKALRSTVGD